MIFGHIQNWEHDRLFLPAPLVKGLEYLKNTDFSKLSDGRYEIEGSLIFAIVQKYQTTPKSQNEAETHQKYIDIQYLYRGEEIIGYGVATLENEILQDSLAEKDAILYKSVRDEMELIFTEGMYAVFFPSDIHRPCCSRGAGTQVKKVVIKVASELLKS